MSFTSAYSNIRNNFTEHTIKAYSKIELQNIIKKEIDRLGWDCSLNHIDVSEITDFSQLFNDSYLHSFNGDISEWNVSNGCNFSYMFARTEFNGNISRWDVSNAKNMSFMFANSTFNRDISMWNMKNVIDTRYMFYYNKTFNQEIGFWELTNVCNMENMFGYAIGFNQDISDWNIEHCACINMFNGSLIDIVSKPLWYKKQYELYSSEVRRMKKINWCTNEYHTISADELQYLNAGIHSIFLDKDNGQILGHHNGKDCTVKKYDIEIKEGMNNLDYSVLYKTIKKLDFEKFNCTYLNALSKFYPNSFISYMKPWKTVKTKCKDIWSNNIDYIKESLYLLDSVNWHAYKAGLPYITRNENNKLEYSKNINISEINQ